MRKHQSFQEDPVYRISKIKGEKGDEEGANGIIIVPEGRNKGS